MLFKNLPDALEFLVQYVIPRRAGYILNVNGPQTGLGFGNIIQVVDEDRPYGNKEHGLTLHLSFDQCLAQLKAYDRFKAFSRFDEFDDQPLGEVPCHDVKLGTNIPAALRMIAAVLHEVYEFPECTAFSCEVWVDWPDLRVRGSNNTAAAHWVRGYQRQLKQKGADLVRDNRIRDLTDPSLEPDGYREAANQVAKIGDDKCRAALAYLITDPDTEQELVAACISALAYCEIERCKDTLRTIIHDRRNNYNLRRLCATTLSKAVRIEKIADAEPMVRACFITLDDLSDDEKYALNHATRLRRVILTERLEEAFDYLMQYGLAYECRDMYLPWIRLTAAGERLRQELLLAKQANVSNRRAA